MEKPMRRLLLVFTLAAFSIALFGAWSPSTAQFGRLKDKLKQKVEQKADQKVDRKIDDTLNGKKSDDSKKDESGGESNDAKEDKGNEGAAAPKSTKGTASAEDMTLYAKYDFIPGDKVIFYDDLAREEMGEFPSRWSLDNGVFENVKMAGQNWILCSNSGSIRPKIPAGPLPDKYTVEMEIWADGKNDGWYNIRWLAEDDHEIGKLEIGYGYMTKLWILDKNLADKGIERLAPGKHVLRIMATRSTIKCYIDQERLANVPKVDGFAPFKFAVAINPYYNENKTAVIGAFRYAEGGKTLKEQLDEDGKIVTHGILFDTGSAKIKAESYKTLADIGGLLTDNPELKVSIEGHTDSDGSDTANQTLSQSRAESVKAYLVENFKVDAGRLETKGWGEGKPMASNDTPEGKAMNRRVELVKL
jgi:OmpA-OmpF porin, OOP family